MMVGAIHNLTSNRKVFHMALKVITRKDGNTLKMGRKKPVMKFTGHTFGEYLKGANVTLPTPPAAGSISILPIAGLRLRRGSSGSDCRTASSLWTDPA